jgi:hypothetical protein
LTKNNDLSFTALAAVACFLAASHETMLVWLKKKQAEGVNGAELLAYWNELMERHPDRTAREQFFSEVVMSGSIS